jgi:hypothetical protein
MVKVFYTTKKIAADQWLRNTDLDYCTAFNSVLPVVYRYGTAASRYLTERSYQER